VDAPRAGNVGITVGILNSGDSDGTLDSSALLTLPWGHLDAHAERYTAVRAHGFEKVTFLTPWFDGKHFRGEITKGDEEAVKKLTEKVRKGEKVTFTIDVSLSDKHRRQSGTINP
jgi:hypothetical protein